MSLLLKTVASVVVPLALVGSVAACAQQTPPDTHTASMSGGTMNNGGVMGNGMMGGGMMSNGMMGNGIMGGGMTGNGDMGNHPAGTGNPMPDMGKMMTQMSQMVDRCNAMMQIHQMHPSDGHDDGHSS